MNDVLERALHLRNLAEEARAKAASLKSQEAREILRKLAFDYDKAAETLEFAAKSAASKTSRTRKPSH